MGAVQVQILGPDQGTRMAPTSATKLAPTSSTRSITATRSRLGTSLLSLLLLPLSKAIPQPAENQNWLARSTCVLDALAPGGVVDSQKFNECMDCWRRFHALVMMMMMMTTVMMTTMIITKMMMITMLMT